MRILHVIHTVDPAVGGTIEALKQLCLSALRNGHEVDVVSMDAPGAQHLTGFPLPLYPLGPRWLFYGFGPRFVPWLRANRTKYDAVVVHGVWTYVSFAVWLALRHTDTPYVVYTHGMLDPWFKRNYPLKHVKKWLYWPWAEYRVLRDATAVLFTSDQERLLARQSFWLYRCNELVVNLGTNLPVVDASQVKAEFFERYPNLKGKRFLLCVGRIHEKKGCDILLRAFAGISNGNDIDLVFVGPDQSGWQAQLKLLAEKLGVSNRVTWTGMLQGPAKWGAYYAADTFVLPSHSENFGIAVVEALACGLPVLISKRVNIWREIVSDGAGLAASDDLEGTIGLLASWLDMSLQQQNSMRDRARESFAARFNLASSDSGLTSAISALLGRGQVTRVREESVQTV